MQVSAESKDSSRAASVNSLMHAVLSVGRLMRQRGRGETLDTGSFWLLKSLAASGPQRLTDLATCTDLDVSTVSRHVAQLHSAGLIERTPDPADGRAHLIGRDACLSLDICRVIALRDRLDRRPSIGAGADVIEIDQVFFNRNI